MTENTQQPAQLSRLQRLRDVLLSRTTVRICWFVNALLLVGLFTWILRDGKFPEGVATFAKHIAAIGSDKSPLTVVQPLMWPRVDALWFVLIAGTVSIGGILAGLVAGSATHRGLRSWLALTLLSAGWLTLFTTWPELAWRGQAWRVRASVDEFEVLAKKLLAEWPRQDGKIAGLGAYMAYPIGNPRTLMMLTSPELPGTGLAISTIERGDQNDLHFQLTGNDEGVWLVRNLNRDEPLPFFSGLEGEYIPLKYSRLRPGWFLVQYKYAPILPDATPEIIRPRR